MAPETVSVGGEFAEGGEAFGGNGPFTFVNQEAEPREAFIERVATELFVARFASMGFEHGMQAKEAVESATALADALGK